MIYSREMNYQNGNIVIDPFAAGSYILNIWSNDKKYRHIQKIVKQ
jgi:hypothetical protein